MTLQPIALLLLTLRCLASAGGVAAVFAVFAVSSARAEDAPAGPDAAALLRQLDANSDGFLTVDEVPAEKQALLRRLLRTADSDKDGKLSRDEFVAGMKTSRPERGANGAGEPRGFAGLDPDTFFKRKDANGDGKITPDEVPEERRERFSTMLGYADANSDGGLDRDEFNKMRERLTGALAGKGTPGQAAKGTPGEAGASSPGDRSEGGQSAEVVFRALDKNNDGKLSADEISKAAESLAALDKDGDGSITLAELQRARPRLGQAVAGTGGFDPARLWKRMMENRDKNSDGKLSEEEMPDRFRPGFSRLDRNGDGFVDEAEMKAGLERLREAAESKK